MTPALLNSSSFLSLFVAKNKCRKWWRDSLLFSLIHSIFACLFRIFFCARLLLLSIITLVCELSIIYGGGEPDVRLLPIELWLSSRVIFAFLVEQVGYIQYACEMHHHHCTDVFATHVESAIKFIAFAFFFVFVIYARQ